MNTPEPSTGELGPELRGLLAIVVMEPLPPGAAIEGLPGIWSSRPDGKAGARVQLAHGEHLVVGGIATSGTVDIDPSDAARPSQQSVMLDDDRAIVLFHMQDAGSGQTWIALTSATAPRLTSFRGVSSYPNDDRWRIPVSFTPVDEADRVSMVRRFRSGEQLIGMDRAGWLDATIDARSYRFTVDQVSDYAYVNFRDASSGTESYGAGRVLRLPADPATIDVLDFNLAAVPPCAFNPLVNCPLPSENNVIASSVRAGQRDVLFNEMP